ncbi:MAG TPA: DNA-directed RNA polymerase subunit alpha [Nitrospinota bacterium]|nr:DNA-directed RNA polymerase subunit alpha [Nitrospinota bacterium]
MDNTPWEGLTKPKRLECVEKNEIYGKFIAQPFERGFGITIGNSLRRFLLSSIQGAAVTAVKFDKVYHEFSSLPGVVEDIIDIILNIKELKIKLHSDGPKKIYIKAKTPGPLTAGSIETGNDVEILNPDHVIATLDQDGKLDAELIVNKGRGYLPAEQQDVDEETDIQMIPIDALFSPIQRANFHVEKTRVKQSSNFDRLVFEIWTNGSIIPEDAIAHAAKIMKDHLQIFINFEEEPEQTVPEVDEQKMKTIKALAKSVEELELSVRSYNCLKNANIKTLGELVQKTDTEMLKTRNFGRKSLNEIKEIMEEMGLTLGYEISEEDKEQLKILEQEKKQ